MTGSSPSSSNSARRRSASSRCLKDPAWNKYGSGSSVAVGVLRTSARRLYRALHFLHLLNRFFGQAGLKVEARLGNDYSLAASGVPVAVAQACRIRQCREVANKTQEHALLKRPQYKVASPLRQTGLRQCVAVPVFFGRGLFEYCCPSFVWHNLAPLFT